MAVSSGLVEYLESVVYGRRGDALSRAVRSALLGLSGLYRAALWLYLLPFRLGIRKTRRLPGPVISVGNITVGGTGKTTAVQYLCRKLQSRGFKPAVLSYGYGGSLGGRFGIVSDREKLLLGPEAAGDEPAMLATTMPGVPVLVCKDRYRSGTRALSDLGSNALVLDDGFQVWKLHRDLEIVLVNASRPVDNGNTLPAGRLRETVSSLRRADCIIATGECGPDARKANLAKLQSIAPSVPVFDGWFKPTYLLSLKDMAEYPLSLIRGRKIFSFCSIANPASFELTLENLGTRIVDAERFPDHHPYSAEDITFINRCAEDVRADFVVTTEKDAIKLDASQFSFPLLVLRVELELGDEDDFLNLVDNRLSGFSK